MLRIENRAPLKKLAVFFCINHKKKLFLHIKFKIKMAKTIKSIKCPQCNSTEATKLDDGTFVCKYCGAHFFVDDDTVTQNINVTVNVTQESNAPTRNKTKQEPKQETVQGNAPKQLPNTKSTMLGCIVMLVLLGLVVLFFKFACNSDSPNPKFKGTIAENLINEDVWDSEAMLSNGKPVFLVRVREKYSDEWALKIIDGKSLLVIDTIDCPINPRDFKTLFEDYKCIVTNNTIYKFDNDKREYVDVTSDILIKIPNFDKTKVAKITKTKSYDGSYGISITAKNAASYYYFPLTGNIYTDENVFKSECQNIKEDKTTYFLKEQQDGIYSLYKVEYVYTPGQKIEWEKYIRMFGHKKGNQISDFINDVKEINRYKFDETHSDNIYSGHIIYEDNDYLLLSYKKGNVNFISRLNTNGEGIWTKQVKYDFAGGNGIKGDSIIIMQGSWHQEYLIFNYIDTTFKHLEQHWAN